MLHTYRENSWKNLTKFPVNGMNQNHRESVAPMRIPSAPSFVEGSDEEEEVKVIEQEENKE